MYNCRMIKSRLFQQTLLLLFLVAALNFIDDTFYLYLSVPWVDTILHFFAGSSVGMASFLVLGHFSAFSEFGKTKKIILAVTVGLSVGLLWELYELYFGITFWSDGILYFKDTASDLSMDIVGSLAGALYSLKLINNK